MVLQNVGGDRSAFSSISQFPFKIWFRGYIPLLPLSENLGRLMIFQFPFRLSTNKQNSHCVIKKITIQTFDKINIQSHIRVKILTGFRTKSLT